MLRENDFLQSFDGHQLRPLKGIAFYQPQGWLTCGAGPRRSHLAFWQKFQKNITRTSKNFLVKISEKFLKEFLKKFKKKIKKKNQKKNQIKITYISILLSTILQFEDVLKAF